MRRSVTEIRYGNDISALLLRLVFGLAMFYEHGLGKWQVLFGNGEIQFPDPFGIGATFSLILAVFAEVVCAILVAAGLFTRYAIVPLIVTMAVAVFVVHSGDAFGKIELPLAYLVGYVAIFLMGPGNFSVDRLIRN
ncbi:DoxX family protein [Brumimicrobium oceani]|uniref:DoxX family protein n=1 Tax=Brumimicrobium oceani TaxID=2100725 RepID=A0A2U2XDD8_9FLAO|nr:DoxX family protein [Brumimicrobium oceani]PWH85804.1 DoxX family protein [Brumimicrobium oceani]